MQQDVNVTVKIHGQPVFFPRSPSSSSASDEHAASTTTYRRALADRSNNEAAADDDEASNMEGCYAYEALPTKGELDCVQVVWVHETCAQICPLVMIHVVVIMMMLYNHKPNINMKHERLLSFVSFSLNFLLKNNNSVAFFPLLILSCFPLF